MKKVIFVGGTSFSGSTFFHMTLANDPKGFAVGESRWLFNPHRSYHVNRLCGCGDENCQVWPQVYKNGSDRLFDSIFDQFPEVEFIVDSSKNPFWIAKQMDILQKRGIETENIIIWKTPLEFANSSKKRNRFENWDSEWINYHRLYFSLIQNWKGVKYYDLVNDEATLKKACAYLGIPYFADKESYWNRTHHSFGGSLSARFHLHDRTVAQKRYLDHSHDKQRMSLYRKVYYTGVEDEDVQKLVEDKLEQSGYFEAILDAFNAQSVLHEGASSQILSDVQLSFPMVELRRMKHLLRDQVAKYRYGRYINY